MSSNVTWNGTTYSIPASGEVGWSALRTFLIDLGTNAQTTNIQKFASRKATTTPVTVSASTDCVVATNLGTPGAVTVNLPAGAAGLAFIIVDDKGDAGTNNITINRNGSDTIAGGTSLVLSHNREAACLVFNSSDTDWKIAYRTLPTGTIVNADIASGAAIAGTKIVSATTATSGVIAASGTQVLPIIADVSASTNGVKVQTSRTPATGDTQNVYSCAYTWGSPSNLTGTANGSGASFGTAWIVRVGINATIGFRCRPTTSGAGAFGFRLANPFGYTFSAGEAAGTLTSSDGGTSIQTITISAVASSTDLLFAGIGAHGALSTDDFYGTITMRCA